MSTEESGQGQGTGEEEESDSQSQQQQRLPNSYFKEKPVKVGEELVVTVSETSRRGDGVARIQGYVIFIPSTKQGQQARIKIKEIRPNFATAELLET